VQKILFKNHYYKFEGLSRFFKSTDISNLSENALRFRREKEYYNIASIVLHYREIPNHNIGLKYNTWSLPQRTSKSNDYETEH